MTQSIDPPTFPATGNHPYAILHHLEQRSLNVGAEVPREEKQKITWTGVAFALGDNLFLASLRDIQEVLDCPPLTAVPRTKKWLKGVANVRGRLLPIVDLELYLGGHEQPIQEDSRILIVQYGALSVGLLAGTVLGQRHFQDEDSCPVPPFEANGEDNKKTNRMMEYVRPMAYHSKEGIWLLFDVRKLVTSPQFLQVTT